MNSAYSEVDIDRWERKEHYQYYTEQLQVEFNITVNIHVEKLIHFCHARGYRFYPALISVTTKAVNSIDNFKMFRDAAGQLCIWDHVVPNFTIFHQDDKTFSDCWSAYDEQFAKQYDNIVRDMRQYKDVKGIKVKENQPPDFFCISCVPWLAFSGFSSTVFGREPQFFPVITAGKYEWIQGRAVQPVALTIAHAVCDGYHADLFFKCLQAEIDALEP